MTEQDEFAKRQSFRSWIIKDKIGRGSFVDLIKL
jgi:hypothetical protein